MAKLDKLVTKLEPHLEEGEEVVRTVLGSYETKIAGQDSVRSGIFAATNRRLVFFAKKLGGFDLEVFPYENISSIEMGKSLMGHHISFFASGNKVAMKWIKSDGAAEFVNEVKSRMKGGSAASPTPVPTDGGTTDVAEQIRKIAALRDEGLLTAEEFETKKAELLTKL